MRRPTGIVLISLLLVGYGIAAVFLTMTLLQHPEVGASLQRTYLYHWFPDWRPDADILLLVAGCSAIYSLAVGSGLWFLWSPARWGLVLGCVLSLGCNLIILLTTVLTDAHDVARMPEAFWFQSIVLLAIFLYMVREDVQRVFDVPVEHFDGVYYARSTPKDSIEANRDYSGRR